jgi:hypothetical protein
VLQESGSLQMELERRIVLIFHQYTVREEGVELLLRNLGFITGSWGRWSVAVMGISIELAAELLDSLGLRYDA